MKSDWNIGGATWFTEPTEDTWFGTPENRKEMRNG